jgi:hypothetical protein
MLRKVFVLELSYMIHLMHLMFCLPNNVKIFFCILNVMVNQLTNFSMLYLMQ